MQQPALFLDRDGIVIFDSGYVREATNVRLIPGITELIQKARVAGWKVLVVTNQSGLGRGWISLAEYKTVSDRMIELLEAHQLTFDGIYFCPFFEPSNPGAPELQNPRFQSRGIQQYGKWDSSWRKPMGGMLLQAAQDHGIDLQRSIMVGDRATDAVAGCAAGVAKTYLLTASTQASEDEVDEISVWRSRVPQLHPILIQTLGEVPIL